jgi:hypothetical protein
MPMVWMGNPSAIHHPGGVPTTAYVPDTYTLSEQVHNLAHPAEGQWVAHSYSRRPSWVDSDSPELAQALADEFGCPKGRPQSEVSK